MKIRNQHLVLTINFLQGMKLKAAESRSRSKLVKLLSEKLKELQTDEKALLEEYAVKDEDGKAVMIDENQYDIAKENKPEFGKEHVVLLNEEVTITTTDYADHFENVKKSLEAYDEELSGTDADVYDLLMNELEKGNN